MAIQDYITDNHEEQTKNLSPAQIAAPEHLHTSIKVIGVGSGGCNCVRNMMQRSVPAMTFAMVNTDDHREMTVDSRVDVVQINESKARAWELGGDQQFVETDASTESLRRSIAGSDLVFVTAGMGGGIGTGAVPYVAQLAKEQGALVLGLVTTPFSFEGPRRMGLAVAGIDRLRPLLDNLILIHNDRLLTFVKWDSETAQAFRTADDVVTEGIMGLSELINVPQELNVDFSDIKKMMKHRGRSLMAIGRGSGTNGPKTAAIQAVENPLLDLSIEQAASVLIIVRGGTAALTLGGINAARQVVVDAAHNAEKIMISVRVDETMGEGVNLTLFATGLRQAQSEPSRRVGQTGNPSLAASWNIALIDPKPVGAGQRTIARSSSP